MSVQDEDYPWFYGLANRPNDMLPNYQESVSACVSAFDGWKCAGCGTEDQRMLEEGASCWVCTICGFCQKGLGLVCSDYVRAEEHPASPRHYTTSKPLDKDGAPLRCRISYGIGVKRRYKRKFYYRERLAQWYVTTSLRVLLWLSGSSFTPRNRRDPGSTPGWRI